jgi:hypothetical protein
MPLVREENDSVRSQNDFVSVPGNRGRPQMLCKERYLPLISAYRYFTGTAAVTETGPAII